MVASTVRPWTHGGPWSTGEFLQGREASGDGPGKQPAGGDEKVVFTCDYQHRRVEKQVFVHNGSGWPAQPSTRTRFLWDGRLMLLELDGLSSNAVLRRYTWGLDLAGQRGASASGRSGLEGAGGIGGLLAVRDETVGLLGAEYVYTYDAGGNVGQLVNLWVLTWNANGVMKARYEYDPYGNLTSEAGTYAATNRIRFSTKYWDAETNLGYWGRRYYRPDIGRWLNRDPIHELGGHNSYAFVLNSPSGPVDPRGLFLWGCSRRPQPPPPPSPGTICGPIPNPNPTDADCCNAARPKCAKGDGGGVICCNGRKISCSFWKPNPGTPGDSILETCIIVHEDDHHDDVSCSGCPPRQICRPNWDPGKNPRNEECSAHWKEIDCLLRHGQTTCHSLPTKADQIACVRRVTQRIKQQCNAMKGNPNCKTLPGICGAFGITK